ncbi:TasA family protein [Virgibacillus sp. MSJ-26]|uniref:TasA family protein n=1 Tax=Virgibacillus sp. MSJ-26 TaxID=2841522 RepID=UPI00353028D0
MIDVEGDNIEDFVEHNSVDFLYNADNLDDVIYETTLAELKDMSAEEVNERIFYPILWKKITARVELILTQ